MQRVAQDSMFPHTVAAATVPETMLDRIRLDAVIYTIIGPCFGLLIRLLDGDHGVYKYYKTHDAGSDRAIVARLAEFGRTVGNWLTMHPVRIWLLWRTSWAETFSTSRPESKR